MRTRDKNDLHVANGMDYDIERDHIKALRCSQCVVYNNCDLYDRFSSLQRPFDIELLQDIVSQLNFLKFLVHGQVTIIFVVSVGVSVCLMSGSSCVP